MDVLTMSLFDVAIAFRNRTDDFIADVDEMGFFLYYDAIRREYLVARWDNWSMSYSDSVFISKVNAQKCADWLNANSKTSFGANGDMYITFRKDAYIHG
jgi:hypothetical protein